LRRAARVAKGIEQALRGEIRLGEMVAAKRGSDARTEAFALAPDVTISNNLSNRFTVLEVSGLDRPGLLFDLTAVLSRLNLNIGSAHIVTFGEKAVDAFYVTDLTGSKIVSPARQATMKRNILAIFEKRDEKRATAAHRSGA
jgi:[protein-PII] uridylyltransferase